LDSNLGRIHGVRLETGSTKIRTIRDPKAQFLLCSELGYHASDLLQSNCVIWVEGPSDRIYMMRWLSDVDNELIEGIHYSVMFYGGRLLSHLSAYDLDEVRAFISLARLNRNMVIVMDSDRNHRRHPINATKRRVRDEVQQAGGLAWVTRGRTIESYYPIDQLRTAVPEGSRRRTTIPRGADIYTNLFGGAEGRSGRIDKIKLANKLTTTPTPLKHLDLAAQLKRLVRYIRRANNLDALRS
jgi:hypothetical protein